MLAPERSNDAWLDELIPILREGASLWRRALRLAEQRDRASKRAAKQHRHGPKKQHTSGEVERALRVAAGNRSIAARRLGVSRTTLHRYLRAYGLGTAGGGVAEPCLSTSRPAPDDRPSDLVPSDGASQDYP